MKKIPLLTLTLCGFAMLLTVVNGQDGLRSNSRGIRAGSENTSGLRSLERTAMLTTRAALRVPEAAVTSSVRSQPPSRIRLLPPEEVLADRMHDIVLDADKGFIGRIYSITPEGLRPAAGMQVQLLAGGEVRGESATDATGRFRLTGIATGEYKTQVAGILATGPSGMLIFGVRFVEPTPENPGGEEVQLDTTAIPASEAKLARSIIFGNIGTRDLRFNRPASPDDFDYPVGDGPTSTSVNYHRIRIAEDGRVYGQVNLLDERTGLHREILSMRIYFLKDGVEAGSARVAPNGAFSVPAIEPGIYGFVGAGRDGVFGIGVEVLPPREVAATQGLQDAVPVRIELAEFETIAIAPVTAANLNSDNVETFIGSDVGVANPAEALDPQLQQQSPTGSLSFSEGTVGGTSGGASVGSSGFGATVTNGALGVGTGFLVDQLISEFE